MPLPATGSIVNESECHVNAMHGLLLCLGRKRPELDSMPGESRDRRIHVYRWLYSNVMKVL